MLDFNQIVQILETSGRESGRVLPSKHRVCYIVSAVMA